MLNYLCFQKLLLNQDPLALTAMEFLMQEADGFLGRQERL
jgi:hypothetical protein